MEIKGNVLKEKIITLEIICDCCGKSCKTQMGFEFMLMSANWGYDSNKDLEKWEAQICEECIDNKFKFVKFNKGKYI